MCSSFHPGPVIELLDGLRCFDLAGVGNVQEVKVEDSGTGQQWYNDASSVVDEERRAKHILNMDELSNVPEHTGRVGVG